MKRSAWILSMAGVVSLLIASGCSDDKKAADAASTSGALVGAACVDNAGCASGYCITTDQFKTLTSGMNNAEIPMGYCSRLSCLAQEDCGEGADCFNLAQYMLQLQICLKVCTADTDCRNGYVCTDGSGPNLPGQPKKSCLPPPLLCLLDIPHASCPLDAGTDATSASDAAVDTGSVDAAADGG